MDHPRPLFCLFKQTLQFVQQIYVKKCRNVISRFRQKSFITSTNGIFFRRYQATYVVKIRLQCWQKKISLLHSHDVWRKEWAPPPNKMTIVVNANWSEKFLSFFLSFSLSFFLSIILSLFLLHTQTVKQTFLDTGGSPGLVVMGEDSCSKGCEFESRHRI